MTTKKELLTTIRKHCFECCGDSCVDVKNCTAHGMCALWPFRHGKDPNPASTRVVNGVKNTLSVEGN